MTEQQQQKPAAASVEMEVPSAMSASALKEKLRLLREKSNKHSQVLTQKLASSQSGQNLLHIGTSLSTLPPTLHSLLTQLHPVLSAAESSEKHHLDQLQKLVKAANEIRVEERKVRHAAECADLYLDLVAAERDVSRDADMRRTGRHFVTNLNEDGDDVDDEAAEEDASGGIRDELDHVSSLERAAHTALCLVQDLEASTAQISALTTTKVVPAESANALPSLHTPLEDDMERAQFLMKLSPRIRRLESDTVTCLSLHLENLLKRLQQRGERLEDEGGDAIQDDEDLLLMIGNCMRGLAVTGRGQEVENIFARIAIMPLIRSKVSMGRLDEGGSRGECAGLFSLLDDMACSISETFGPVLRLAEATFDVGSKIDVDLITAGVWVPIATALMADPGIKMAIFSPGIASILQANYIALDTFLAELAGRLLEPPADFATTNGSTMTSLYYRPTVSAEFVQRAQDRIYSHPKTADFSKKWNLPIYYQLRFGECCNRLNKAINLTQKQGWIAEVFTGTEEEAHAMKNDIGFELFLFLECYHILLGLWKPDVILRPLTHRFLRGAVQVVGRMVAFVRDGMEGKVKFGEEPQAKSEAEANGLDVNGPAYPTRSPYCWGDSEEDVAAVSWELTILETTLTHDYVNTVCESIANEDSTEAERQEFKKLALDVLKEASQPIRPIVDKAWNEVIVNIVTKKCSGPLGAVKGVAATYRMTNRPPPTQASPFVATILRPLREFDNMFADRTPHHIGSKWKNLIVSTVAERYSVAVKELIATVQRTEVALKNRKARRTTAGGMSDGEKVKLQLYLDYQEFSRQVEVVGVDPLSMSGLTELKNLTVEAESLLQSKRNGFGKK